jgi:hypothetical protein
VNVPHVPPICVICSAQYALDAKISRRGGNGNFSSFLVDTLASMYFNSALKNIDLESYDMSGICLVFE